LAGLIDGDGHISKTYIQICFNILDLPLAIYLKKVLGYGSISKVKGKKACLLNIGNIIGIDKVLNLINGLPHKNKKPKQIKSSFQIA
jgi:hypothetical protein